MNIKSKGFFSPRTSQPTIRPETQGNIVDIKNGVTEQAQQAQETSLTPDNDSRFQAVEASLHNADNQVGIHEDQSLNEQQPAAESPLAAFKAKWRRIDGPVAEGKVKDRSWTWGPEVFANPNEGYAQSPNGARAVLYYDKTRMEINDPNADPESPYFVTNGLLVTELMTGKMQFGDATFKDFQPADVNVAGDPGIPTGITYADLGKYMTAEPLPVGAVVNTRLSKDENKNVSKNNDASLDAQNVRIAAVNPTTQQPIPEAFWNYMNSTGDVYNDAGQLIKAKIYNDPYEGTGFPMTPPMWMKATVGGVEKDVLVQAFQRRVLTLTPSNPPAFQVEMGNVGRHYYDWRYKQNRVPEAPAPGVPNPEPLPNPDQNETDRKVFEGKGWKMSYHPDVPIWLQPTNSKNLDVIDGKLREYGFNNGLGLNLYKDEQDLLAAGLDPKKLDRWTLQRSPDRLLVDIGKMWGRTGSITEGQFHGFIYGMSQIKDINNPQLLKLELASMMLSQGIGNANKKGLTALDNELIQLIMANTELASKEPLQ